MLKPGTKVFVKVGGEYGIGTYYFEGKVREHIPASGKIASCGAFRFLGYDIAENEEMRLSDGMISIEGYDAHDFLAENVFFSMPEGKENILTPMERWIRAGKIIEEEKTIKGFLIKKKTHISGNITNISYVYEWEIDNKAHPHIVHDQDKTWEEIYKSFAAFLAIQR